MVVGDDFVVIALSGATNGGKTTLVKRLLQELQEARCLNQDTFFISEDDSRHRWLETDTFRHQNWELPSAIDFDMLKNEIRSLTASGTGLSYRILLIEGHVLFADPEICTWCDIKYFLTLTKEQCRERRNRRIYQPPDPPGYFDACIYPEYLNHLSHVQNKVKDVIYLDGSSSLETTFQKILGDIRQILSP